MANWYIDKIGWTKCSNCNHIQIHSDDGGGVDYKTPYCPWCGAQMENADENPKNH